MKERLIQRFLPMLLFLMSLTACSVTGISSKTQSSEQTATASIVLCGQNITPATLPDYTGEFHAYDLGSYSLSNLGYGSDSQDDYPALYESYGKLYAITTDYRKQLKQRDVYIVQAVGAYQKVKSQLNSVIKCLNTLQTSGAINQ